MHIMFAAQAQAQDEEAVPLQQPEPEQLEAVPPAEEEAAPPAAAVAEAAVEEKAPPAAVAEAAVEEEPAAAAAEAAVEEEAPLAAAAFVPQSAAAAIIAAIDVGSIAEQLAAELGRQVVSSVKAQLIGIKHSMQLELKREFGEMRAELGLQREQVRARQHLRPHVRALGRLQVATHV